MQESPIFKGCKLRVLASGLVVSLLLPKKYGQAREHMICIFIWSDTKHVCCTIHAFLISDVYLQRFYKNAF